jgi:hypothetical protein
MIFLFVVEKRIHHAAYVVERVHCHHPFVMLQQITDIGCGIYNPRGMENALPPGIDMFRRRTYLRSRKVKVCVSLSDLYDSTRGSHIRC